MNYRYYKVKQICNKKHLPSIFKNSKIETSKLLLVFVLNISERVEPITDFLLLLLSHGGGPQAAAGIIFENRICSFLIRDIQGAF